MKIVRLGLHLLGSGVLCTGFFACSSSNSSDGATGGDDAGATIQKNLECPALLDCIVNCASGDDVCTNDCINRGTDNGLTTANALAQCLEDNSCQDTACVNTHCSTELAACLAVPEPTGGTPIEGTAPTGSVPADFVGTWKDTTYTSADDFTFNADGTATRSQLETSSFSGCSSSVAFEYHGTVVFTPAQDGFTFYITSATNTSNACGSQSSTPGETGAFDFTIEPIPALGPGHMWIFRVQDCPVTNETDKRIQCGGEYDL